MRHKYLKNVTTLSFDKQKCINCFICVTVCPHRVFHIINNKVEIVDKNKCMECGACMNNCISGALFVNKGVGCAYAITGLGNGDCSEECC
ncbi:MAG: 4Fe-4S dicluster domain-containing protein [Candidatus Muiribacteriota bacterium]